jgi:hypothetical protein
MELKDLVGRHTLDAVDFETQKIPGWGGGFEDCNCIRFRVDGVVYIALEDPVDGYRSSMRELMIVDCKMTNVFPEVKVLARHRTINEYHDIDNVLELIDERTGKVIVEVGTANTDDYYPYFVAKFHPEAMVINVKKES